MSLGRWNGRFSGCREIASGNIADCLYTDMDYATWYVDKNGDLRCDAVHHDVISVEPVSHKALTAIMLPSPPTAT